MIRFFIIINRVAKLNGDDNHGFCKDNRHKTRDWKKNRVVLKSLRCQKEWRIGVCHWIEAIGEMFFPWISADCDNEGWVNSPVRIHLESQKCLIY